MVKYTIMNEREKAKQNLLILVNTCINRGGIFTDAASVALMVNSIHVLDAYSENGPTAMKSVKSASEQIQDRIDNN